MKRLSLLVAILLIATIGGVYAAWTYADSSTDMGTHIERNITLDDAETTGLAGTYSMSTNLNMLKIVPNNQDDKKAVLDPTFVVDSGDKLTVTLNFTPTETAEGSVKANGIKTYVYFGTATDLVYRGNPIFNFGYGKGAPYVINAIGETGGNATWTPNGDSFTCTIVFEDFAQFISFADPDLALPQRADWDEFRRALTGGDSELSVNLHMHVSNVAPVVLS